MNMERKTPYHMLFSTRWLLVRKHHTQFQGNILSPIKFFDYSNYIVLSVFLLELSIYIIGASVLLQKKNI